MNINRKLIALLLSVVMTAEPRGPSPIEMPRSACLIVSKAGTAATTQPNA